MALSTANDNNPWNKINAYSSRDQAIAAARAAGVEANIYQTSGGSWHWQPQYTSNNNPVDQATYEKTYGKSSTSSGYGGGGSGGGATAGKTALTHDQIISMGLDENNLPPQYYRADGGGQGSPLEEINNAIQSSFQDLQNEVIKRFGDYTSGNPFKVDDVLAAKTKEAKEQIDPYYDQILGDYILGATMKKNRSIDDTRDLLSELSASVGSYEKSSQIGLEDALTKAEQGFADSGLFGSGQALSTEGKIKQSVGSNLSDYLRKSSLQEKQLKTGLDRNLTDIGLDTNQYATNLEQNRATDTSTRASQLTKEAGQSYIQGFQATLPTELQSASGFDMLKSLGIYS